MVNTPSYDGPERRSASPLSTALTSIIDLQGEVETLARAVEGNREAVAKSNRKIFVQAISIGLLSLLFLVVLQGSKASKDAVHTLRDCLIVGGQCHTRLAQQGNQGAVRSLKFQACMLNQVPESRNADRTIDCASKSYPEISNIEQQLREVLD